MLHSGKTKHSPKPFQRPLSTFAPSIYDVARRIALDNLETIVGDFFPLAIRKGNYITLGNIDGDKGNSLCIYIHGEKRGGWTDFGTPVTMRKSGDVIHLVAEHLGINIRDAADFIITRYGRSR